MGLQVQYFSVAIVESQRLFGDRQSLLVVPFVQSGGRGQLELSHLSDGMSAKAVGGLGLEGREVSNVGGRCHEDHPGSGALTDVRHARQAAPIMIEYSHTHLVVSVVVFGADGLVE